MITMPAFDGVAACAEIGGDDWFPEVGGEGQAITREVRRICNHCEIQQACLQWALDHDEAGIWGGTTEAQRWQLTGRKAPERANGNTPRPINHGTPGGYRMHSKRGEPMCEECRTAKRIYLAEKRERESA